MAAQGTLAREYIEFIAKGVESVNAAMNKVKGGLAQCEAMSAKMGATMVAAGTLAANAITGAANALVGFAKAGLQGTGMGNLLNKQFEMLARSVASLFLPAFEMVSEILEQARGWFEEFAGTAQHLIGRVMDFVKPILGRMAEIANRLIGPMMAVVDSLLGPLMKVADAIIGPLLKAVEQMSVPFLTLFAAAGDAVGALLDAVAPLVEMMGDLVRVAVTLLVPPMLMWTGLLRVAAGVFKALGGVIAAVVEAAFKPMMQIWDALAKLLVPVFRIVDAIGRTFGKIAEVVGVVLVGALKVAGSLFESIFGDFDALINGLTAAIEVFAVAVERTLGAALAGFAAGFNVLIQQVAQFTRELALALGKINGMEKAAAALLGTANSLGNVRLNLDPADKAQAPGAGKGRQLSAAGGNFEGVAEAWRRLQSASLKTDVDTPELKAARERKKLLEDINKNLEGIRQARNPLLGA